MQGLQSDIEKLQEQVGDPDQDIMSFEEFLIVVNNAGKLLRAADVGLKNRIARLIYLNVRVDSEKVVDYKMREPFTTYFETHKILHGRDLHILLELFKYITENPEQSELLLEGLQASRPSKPQLVQGLVF